MAVTPIDIEHKVTEVDIIVSKSNEEGDITYANPIFFKLSGYSPGELLNKPHAIIRHPDMPKVVFKILWDNIKSGNEVKAFVKNLSADGGFYWVLAHVRVANNPDGSFRNYVSTRRGANPKAREIIEPLYKNLIEIEKNDGIEASEKAVSDFLDANGASMATFNDAMTKLQNL